MIYIVVFLLYLITAKIILLPDVRKDVQVAYRAGNIQEKLYILLMLPIYYFK